MTEIRLYIEGDSQLRPAFGEFLRDLRSRAQERKIRWEVIACGDRVRTVRSFHRALDDHPDAFNILLVDSDAPVRATPWEHLKKSHGGDWTCGAGLNSQCHLMVQMMEAWFLADVESLAGYYGKGFNSGAFPAERDVEKIDKGRILLILNDATRSTSKRKYHKTQHGPDLLMRINPQKVRSAVRHCDRLFQTLAGIIDPPSPPGAGGPATTPPTGPNPA